MLLAVLSGNVEEETWVVDPSSVIDDDEFEFVDRCRWEPSEESADKSNAVLVVEYLDSRGIGGTDTLDVDTLILW